MSSSTFHVALVLLLKVILISKFQAALSEDKSFNSFPEENSYHPSPVYEPTASIVTPVPYETNPLFRHRYQDGSEKLENATTTNEGVLVPDLTSNSTSIDKNDPYFFDNPKNQEHVKEEAAVGEEKDKEESDEESEEESSKESDEEEESGEEGGEATKEGGEGAGKDEETSSEAGGAGVAGQTKIGAQNFVNLIGTDFQPGRLVNIFFGLVLLMFMMIAQGYMMWVFGIAFLPGTRSLNEWEFNPEVLDRAFNLLNSALDVWESDSSGIEKLISFAAKLK